MSLLAIIPCLNEAEHLEALLTNLLEDTAIDMLVVADGGSVDDSKAIVGAFSQRDNRVKLIDNPAKIQSAGVNAAVAAFGQGHDWLLRVDAHCVYPRDYARTLLTSAQKNGADAVVVPMHTKGVAGFQLAAAAAQNSVLGTGGSAHRAGGEGQFIDHGHHALMHMDLFRKVGGYCEAMPCNEDAELDHRLGQVGGKIWLEPLATITYFPRSTPSSLWRQYYKYGIGRACNIRRHKLQPHLRQMLPLAVPLALCIAPLAFALHWVFALPLLAWACACLCLGVVIGIQAGGGSRLFAGFAAAIMHASWAIGFLWGFFRSQNRARPQYGLLQKT